MTSFFELLKSRCSIRKYLDKPVEQEKIKLITSAALMSPASKRSNPWEFVVVQDQEMISKISESREHSSQFLTGAPLAIVVLADTTKSNIWIEDASIASIIIQLQVQDLGLGSCWIQIYNRQKDEKTSSENYVRNLLNVPEKFAILSIISIGYPNEDRKPFEIDKLGQEKIHSEKY